jgi:hypothetical protein
MDVLELQDTSDGTAEERIPASPMSPTSPLGQDKDEASSSSMKSKDNNDSFFSGSDPGSHGSSAFGMDDVSI